LVKNHIAVSRSLLGPAVTIAAMKASIDPQINHVPPTFGLKNAVIEAGKVDNGPANIKIYKGKGSSFRKTNQALIASHK